MGTAQSERPRVVSVPDSAFERWHPRVVGALLITALLLACYWGAWFGERSLVASASTTAYYDFEEAFPLADLWLLCTILAAAVQLLRRRPSALLWMCVSGGSALYLFGMDVLYNLEHGIYSHGAQGLIEMAINVICLTAGTLTLWWAWSNRMPLLGGVPAG